MHRKEKSRGRPSRSRRQKKAAMQENRSPSHSDYSDRNERSSRNGSHAKGKSHNKGRNKSSPRKGVVQCKATVQKNRKGFAFLLFDNKSMEDGFVPPGEAARLFPGDRVEALVDSSGRVKNLRVLEHRFREVVGIYLAKSSTPGFEGRSRGPTGGRSDRYSSKISDHPSKRVQARTPVSQRFEIPTPDSGDSFGSGFGSEGWVIYEKKSAREEIFIPSARAKVQNGDWIRVKLIFHEKGPHPVTGEILEVFGKNLPPSADLPMIAAEYNLVEEHSKAALEEAIHCQKAVFPKPGDRKSMGNRKDLTEVPFITIDGENARDFDDAIYVEKSGSGYILWVAIADVSHYVREKGALDKDARDKGTSVYFPERAFHMLPGALSEGLCSLKPNELRLALVTKMEFDRETVCRRTELMEAVIESKRRATYNQIQTEWEANKKNSKWEFVPHFELYQALRKMRTQRGSIDFELPEAEVSVKPTGEVISIRNRPRLDAHRLIEEFMIAANESVTVWMMKRNWPFIYRIHEEPSQKALERFQDLAATVGVEVSLGHTNSPKIFADLVRKLEGHPAQSLLNSALLRSMKQAIYSATHGIHYGLASQAYTHFTSPIRRYPDLVVHRLIRMALQSQSKGKNLEETLIEICEHCSYRERLAAEAERESIKLKQVRAISAHMGEEFDSKVTGMIGTGIFVQIADPFVEGMIALEGMTDDTYEFNEERMIYYGRRKKNTIKIGDPIRVKVTKADVERRQIDFTMVKKNYEVDSKK